MTLSEVHVALLQAGIPEGICNSAAEAMVRDSHVDSWTCTMISSQVAKMLWLCFVSDHQAIVDTESRLLKARQSMPQEEGNEDGDTAVNFISSLVRNGNSATCLKVLKVDAFTRQLKAVWRDREPTVFCIPGTNPTTKDTNTITIGGMFFSRAAMAYERRVWLPFDQKVIEHAG